MQRSTRTPILAAMMSLCAAAVPAWNGPEAPDELKHVEAGGESLTLWPYTTSDFEKASDPVNLVFPNDDPRAIRQELLKLDGTRPAFSTLPGGICRWTDAMGYEQAAYAEPAGWVGGVVQLASVQPGAPLGSPFRIHIRLFRSGDHTLGNAHFEFLISGAEHEVLSWDLARGLVAYDVGRTGTVVSPVTAASLIPMGAFRAVRGPVFHALVGAGLGPLLSALFLFPPAWPADVPLLTSGEAAVLATDIGFEPRQAKHVASTDVSFNSVAPKPFCSSGSPVLTVNPEQIDPGSKCRCVEPDGVFPSFMDTFSEDTDLVTELTEAYIKGFQTIPEGYGASRAGKLTGGFSRLSVPGRLIESIVTEVALSHFGFHRVAVHNIRVPRNCMVFTFRLAWLDLPTETSVGETL